MSLRGAKCQVVHTFSTIKRSYHILGVSTNSVPSILQRMKTKKETTRLDGRSSLTPSKIMRISRQSKLQLSTLDCSNASGLYASLDSHFWCIRLSDIADSSTPSESLRD